MKRGIIIFKGWGSTDGLYDKFGELLQGEIILSEKLNNLTIEKYSELVVIGWSLGTLDAIRFIIKNNIKNSILIAPTLDFTKTTRPLILKKMIKRLKIERAGCLRDFIELNFSNNSKFENYLDNYFKDILKIHDTELVSGLQQLMEEKIEKFNSELSPLIITGDSDRVIPRENSKDVEECFPNAKIKKLHGGHNLIYEEWAELKDTINTYI